VTHLPSLFDLSGQTAVVTGGGGALGADLSDEAAVSQVSADVDEAFGPAGILVNAISAPVNRHLAEDYPLDEWNYSLASNLTSYFLCSRAAATRMIAAGRGNLAYSAAKGGVVQLTREQAYVWAHHGIRVNAVPPASGPVPSAQVGGGGQADEGVGAARGRSRPGR
jgi:NAD(P)-dependent dehydrogenase (short-subunit alcohol dehydrogenase family)